MYNPSENLAVKGLIVLRKGRVVFTVYKLCYSVGYTYMSVYLGKQQQHATAQITAMHRTVLQFIQRVEGMGHKIFMDKYFTSPVLFYDLFQLKIDVWNSSP